MFWFHVGDLYNWTWWEVETLAQMGFGTFSVNLNDRWEKRMKIMWLNINVQIPTWWSCWEVWTGECEAGVRPTIEWVQLKLGNEW